MTDWKQHLHRHGYRVCFFPLNPRSLFPPNWMNHANFMKSHTVAAQSSLTSRLFSHFIIHCLFIHCSSRSLLPTPPHHCRRPIVWPGEGVSYHGGRYNGGIDTGDPMRSARSLRPCFFFHGWVKHPQERFQVNTHAGVGTDKEKRKSQSSLLQPFRQRQSMAAPWQACSDTAS